MEQLINLTDSIFLGHVSQIDLGASALAAMYYTAIYMLGFGFSLGAQVVIARRNGEGRHKDVGKVFFQGLFFLSAFAVVVFILFKLFSPALLRMVISSGNVYQATMQYIEWRDYSYLFAFPLLGVFNRYSYREFAQIDGAYRFPCAGSRFHRYQRYGRP